MDRSDLRGRMARGDVLAGTFVKTPAYEVIEVLAHSKLDFVCLDAEHAPFDRGRMDACLAMAKALGLPALVRVGAGRPETILSVLDSGATGIVVPHIDTLEKAEAIAKAARFGLGGRGYAGSTRWADYTTQKMPDLLAKSQAETVVIAQIEEPAGVEAAEAIAAVPGIDGLFIGPADLSVAYGKTDINSEELKSAYTRVGAACQANGKTSVTWVANPAKAAELRPSGVSMFFIGSEHSWIMSGASADAAAVQALG